MRFILWSLLAAYLAIVHAWPAAAAPVGAVASGAFIVIAQPPVLLAIALAAIVVKALRRPAHAPARRH